ncbi:MAG TPA: hypothetical protein DCZ10_11720 [Pelotomaculum sp.]|nr:hypothetical protein [Pelotomaculum sp.]
MKYDLTTIAHFENTIANYSNTGTDTITINFPAPITVTGSTIEISELYTDANGNEGAVALVTFVPNPID